MKTKYLLTPLAVVALVAFAAWAPNAIAHDSYHPNDDPTKGCYQCHPGFDGKGPLHSLHVGTKMTENCYLCHISKGDDPKTWISGDGQSCRGCHGVDTGEEYPYGWGVGLRLHHKNAGAPADSDGYFCADCHGEYTDPPTSYPEDTMPVHYGRDDVNVYDPCNSDGSEDWDVDGWGLDNDGDLLYDSDDSDCVAVTCTDNDGDGYAVEGGVCGPIDCDDTDPAINPGAVEECDGVDNDCDGLVDEDDVCAPICTDADGDGYAVEGGDCGPVDCDDSDPAINPGAVEECDGIDNDCDGLVDENDVCIVPSDYDIEGFRCSHRTTIGKATTIKVVIKNEGSTDPGASLTVEGVQGGDIIPIVQDLIVYDPVGNGRTTYSFTYAPTKSGDIIWNATLVDEDPDIDEATCTTIVPY